MKGRWKNFFMNAMKMKQLKTLRTVTKRLILSLDFADYKNGISETSQFLEYFYENLLMGGEYRLRNRDFILKNVLPQIESEK